MPQTPALVNPLVPQAPRNRTVLGWRQGSREEADDKMKKYSKFICCDLAALLCSWKCTGEVTPGLVQLQKGLQASRHLPIGVTQGSPSAQHGLPQGVPVCYSAPQVS